MPLRRDQKEDLVAQYTDKLQKSRALFVTDYRGLNTKEVTALRRQITEAAGEFVIIKNRLFRLAMKNAGLDIPEDFLTGPVAAGFCYGDVPPVAKALTQFAKDSEILVVRGGMLDERFLSDAEVKALADLPPLEVVRAQLLGLLSAPAADIAGVMASSVRQVVNVLSAYVDKAEEPSNGGAPAAVPSADMAEPQPSAEEPVETQEEAEPQASAEEPAETPVEVELEAEEPAETGTAEGEGE